MLFDFLGKTKKQEIVSNHLGGFPDSFTEKQKEAIICSLFIIANCDGEIQMKGKDFLLQSSALLGYSFKKDYIVDLLMTLKPSDITKHLNELNEGQKAWFIIAAHNMVHADVDDSYVKKQYLTGILKSMGISEQRYQDTIKKVQIFIDRFNIR
jgi:hypothetical protein